MPQKGVDGLMSLGSPAAGPQGLICGFSRVLKTQAHYLHLSSLLLRVARWRQELQTQAFTALSLGEERALVPDGWGQSSRPDCHWSELDQVLILVKIAEARSMVARHESNPTP